MERWIQRVVTEQKTDPRVFLPSTPTPLIFNIYFFSLLSTVWTDVKSWSNYLQGNYSTAAALQPQYRGLFSRSPSNQHTDCLSDWDQKKLVFDTSLLILALPNWPSPPTASHLRPYQPRCTPDGISKQQKQSCVSANPPPAATTPLNEMHTAGVHIRQCFHVLFVYQIFLLSVLEDGCSFFRIMMVGRGTRAVARPSHGPPGSCEWRRLKTASLATVTQVNVCSFQQKIGT